jgi:hypothetical protein
MTPKFSRKGLTWHERQMKADLFLHSGQLKDSLLLAHGHAFDYGQGAI